MHAVRCAAQLTVYFSTLLSTPTTGEANMSAKQKVKRALSAVEDAITALKRARSHSDEARSDIDRALRELDDAESDLRRALREIPAE
jgi:chromosome segregation ATPase